MRPSSVAPTSSHRREVSAASDVDRRPASPVKSSSQAPKSHPAANDRGMGSRPESQGPEHMLCSIWVHDESFSREEVLFNPEAIGDVSVRVGDLIEVAAVQDDAALDSGGTTGARDGTEAGSRRPPTGSRTTSERDGDGDGKVRQKKFLFLAKPFPSDLKSRHPNLQLSIASNIANAFGFKNRSQVSLSRAERSQWSASHVELIFRDQFLLRSDMWRLAASELAGRPVYKGQKVLFMGTIKATVKSVYVDEKKALSGYFAPSTVPLFRSESARFVLFIQMSKEMWDFDSEGTGDILFSRVINGFLPELLKRWASAVAHHLVTIVLFTRVQYDFSTSDPATTAFNSANLNRLLDGSSSLETQDFYRVVVNDMPSGRWTAILDELKKEFRIFLRDVSIPPPRFAQSPTSAEEGPRFSDDHPAKISGSPTSALRGNILEAINVASSYLTYEHIGRDLLRTGTSVVVITPGSGVFEVPYDALALTSDFLTSRAIGIDLICLSPMPLHSVPLFKYRVPAADPSRPSKTVPKDENKGLSPESHGLSSNTQAQTTLSTSSGSTVDRPMRLSSTLPSTRAGEWAFGIPNWIDISFWDPRTYKATRTALEKVSKSPIPDTLNEQSKQFIPRVRMYEIQMMGVMESEQSNISVPYLPQVQATLRNTSAAMLHNRGLAERRMSGTTAHPSSPKSMHKPFLSATKRPASYMMSLKESKKNMLSATAKQRTDALEWMDAYDNSAFSAFPKGRRSRRRSKVKRIGNTDSSETERRPGQTGTGLRETRLPPSSQLDRQTSNRERNADKSPISKVTTPAAGAAGRKSIMKSASRPPDPRISRSISFALRGLGPAPRAVASTEINAEHATAFSSASGRVSSSDDNMSRTGDTPDTESRVSSPSGVPKPQGSSTGPEMTPSRPISIKAKSSEEPHTNSHGVDNSLSTATTEAPHEVGVNYAGRSSFTLKRGSMKLDMGSEPEPAFKPSPEKMLAPWIRPVAPWKPARHAHMRSSWFGRWQHVYARMPSTSSIKWKSLKSPAALPLTTEEFPSKQELASDYLQTPYKVYANDDFDSAESSKSREALLREMISLRLSRGFQFVTGKRMREYSMENINIFDMDALSKDGTTMFMSIGNIIHRIICVTEGDIEVTKFTRKAFGGNLSDARDRATCYSPAVKTVLSSQYSKNTINLAFSQEEYNWSYADAFLAGHRDHLTDTARQLGFWRTRFVLIPVQVPSNARHPIPSYSEDNEEEIHLVGIYQLTQLWQKHRYIPPEERRFQSSGRQKRGHNPLNILYQTSDPSNVVAAELGRLLLDDPGLENPPAQLLPDSELFEKSSLNISLLAQTIQGDKGVRMMDRRWHWRLHYNCFIGIEFTTWILQNFRDVDSREEAVELGNELMKHGLFHHVQRRHNFRDGNYFYQIADEYRTARPESRAGWFHSRKADKSTPHTPSVEGVGDSPSSYTKTEKNAEEASGKPSAQTGHKGRKVAVSLAKSMKYDLDARKRSNRPEIIDLHYDRLHNPDNCFHIELSWLNATPKLVEDTVLSWLTTAEKYGLKLVELPISEASSIVETQVFRRPFPIKLKTTPPEPPVPPLHQSMPFPSQGPPDRHYYHKAILKKFDFVLDLESRNAFPADVEVSYSWGKADYRYPQYVHRTGAVLAQITDEGHFLLLANRLFASRAQTGAKDGGKFERSEYSRPRAHTLDHSPRFSPLVRASADIASQLYKSQSANTEPLNAYRLTNQLKNEMQAFVNDTEKLDRFFAEVRTTHPKPVSTKASPTAPSTTDSAIPTLELPASVVSRHNQSPFPQPKPDTPSTKSSSIDAVVHGVGKASPMNDPSGSPYRK